MRSSAEDCSPRHCGGDTSPQHGRARWTGRTVTEHPDPTVEARDRCRRSDWDSLSRCIGHDVGDTGRVRRPTRWRSDELRVSARFWPGEPVRWPTVPMVTPQTRWSFSCDHLMTRPVLGDDLVFVGFWAAQSKGGVVALDRASGDPAWSRDLDAGLRTTPTLAGGRLLLRTFTGLSALDARSGAVLWQVPME